MGIGYWLLALPHLWHVTLVPTVASICQEGQCCWLSLCPSSKTSLPLPAALWATSMSLLGSMGMLVAFSIVYQDEQVPQADLIA